MNLLKLCKNFTAITMALLIVSVSAGAEFFDVPAELSSYGKRIYASAGSYFGNSSFSGYCGTYVRCQLRAMGIFQGGFDMSGDGNMWYSNFSDTDMTSGGYYVHREGGRDCIRNLCEKYGDNLKNIVVSFPVQAGYSYSYPGAGHALVIYEIRDGIAYYSESFSFGGFREGQVIAEDIDSFLKRYTARHGEITGCVMLSQEKQQIDRMDDVEAVIFARLMTSLDNLSDINLVATNFTDASLSHTVI